MINDKQCKEHILNKSPQEAKKFVEDLQFDLNTKEKKSNAKETYTLLTALAVLIIAALTLKLSDMYSMKLIDTMGVTIGSAVSLFFVVFFIKMWFEDYFLKKDKYWVIVAILFILMMPLSVWWPIIQIEFISAQDKLFGIPWYLTDDFPRMLSGVLFLGCLGYFMIKYRRGYH